MNTFWTIRNLFLLYGWSFLVALVLWAMFYLARTSDRWQSARTRHRRIAARFREVLTEDFPAVERIGGVKWHVARGELHRLHSLKNPTHADRESVEHATQFFQPYIAAFLCLLIPFFDYAFVRPPNATVELEFAQVAAFAIPFGIIILCNIAMIGWEFAIRQGYQGVWGALVFDPWPEIPGQREVAEQKAQGRARLGDEAETVAAASGKGARLSSVHDQRF